MASESDKSAGKDVGRAGLPFEPKRDKTGRDNGRDNKKPKGKGESESQVSAKAQARADEILAGNRRKAKAKAAQTDGAKSRTGKRSGKADSGAIPEAVSQRMLRRMAILSGAPVFLGVGIFFLAYYLQSRQIVEFPPVAVLLVTMGCFGLGVLGLTYGVLSASWDTEPGSLVGLSEFKLNFGRVMEARKASKT